MAIGRAEFALRVCPLVPDADAVFVQPVHIGVAAQEPEQFVDHRFHVHLFGRDHRKPGGQVEAHLMAEDRDRASARAVAFLDPVLEHSFHQFVILAHTAFARFVCHILGAIGPGFLSGTAPSIINSQRLYRCCRLRPTMAINGCVISGPDPGAVPGASTIRSRTGTKGFPAFVVGAKQDRRTCKDRLFARYGIRRYRANRTGANDNAMALAA